MKPGDMVLDRISGFKGVATCRPEYLNGCVRWQISPQELHDGKPPFRGACSGVLSAAWRAAPTAVPWHSRWSREPASASPCASGRPLVRCCGPGRLGDGGDQEGGLSL
jgi:hypothetical protein